VGDSGPGFGPHNAEQVFAPFYTTKSTGLGMGLSICRSIIDAHGGRLWASANLPHGAVVQFTVPAYPVVSSWISMQRKAAPGSIGAKVETLRGRLRVYPRAAPVPRMSSNRYGDVMYDPRIKPLARIERFFGLLAEDHTANEFRLGCLIGNLSLELANTSTEVRNAPHPGTATKYSMEEQHHV
jgi:hypothetical protein